MPSGTRTCPRRARPTSAVLLLAIFSMVFAVAPARRAQMLPFVPDPVTTPEFVQYADMLGLSNEQRLAALDAHDAYRTEFRKLEDGEVRQFVRDLTGMARNFMRAGLRVPPRPELEGLIEQLDAIITKAKNIDRGLLDRLVPLLTAEQLARLPSIRIERELDIYAHFMDGPAGLNPAAPVVLSSMVRDLDLADEELLRAEPLLRQYERNAIQRMRKLYRLLQDAATLALDTIDRTGVRDMTPLELMQLGQDEEFEADLRTTFDMGSMPLQAELFEASQKNLVLLRQLTPLLSPAHVDALRDAYYRAGYDRVYNGRSPWRRAYERALSLESVDAERREQIVAQQDRFRRQEDQVIDRVVLAVEDSREYRTIEQFEGEDPEDLERRITRAREDRETIDGSALATLRAILTEEEWASAGPGPGEGDVDSDDVITVTVNAGGGGGAAGASEVVIESEGSEVRLERGVPGLAPAMTQDRRDQLARLAALDDGQRAVLEALFDDYQAAYAAALEEMRQQDAEESEAHAAEDDSKGDTNETNDASKQKEERRSTRMAALAALDDELFDSIALAFEGDAVSRAVGIGRRLRERERTTRATEESTFVFGREEAYTDFVGVVLGMKEAFEITAAMAPGLESYAQNVGPWVDQRLDAARAAQQRRRLASRLEEHGRPGRRRAKELEDEAGESRRRVRSLDRRIRDENRRLVTEAERILDRDLAWALRIAYQRAAYPEIYEDELGIEAAMASVRGLDDLSDAQAARVGGVVNDYRAAFSTLSDRMVRLRGRRDFDFSVMQMPSQEMIEGEIELERLRFDRREAGTRAIVRLRLILSEDQIARCGLRGIPMPRPRAFD